MKTTADMLNFIEDECLDLRCVKDGEDSYHWEVIEHCMSEPQEQIIGVGLTVVCAIEDAMENKGVK